jgi:hypothetical protein
LNLVWTFGGGVLFGDKKTSVTSEQEARHFTLTPIQTFSHSASTLSSTTTLPPVAFDRSNNATVPTVEGSLGLSYRAGGFKVSTGYRWERYFNVLDAGYAEHKDADRTIDGPYFKIAVGFGG